MANIYIQDDIYYSNKELQMFSKEQLRVQEKEIEDSIKMQLAEVENNGPIINNIIEKEKGFNRITIQVESQNSDGGKFIYLYKKVGDIEYKKAGESTQNTFTYEKLEERENYEIRVRLEKNGKRVEKEVKIKTNKIPTSAVSFKKVWAGNVADITVSVSNKYYTVKYRQGETGEWKRNK